MQSRGGFARGQATTPVQYLSDVQAEQLLPLPPPVVQRYLGPLRECLRHRSNTPRVFHEMLHDEEFMRDVNGFYSRAFGELLKEVAWKWWRDCAKSLLHRGHAGMDKGPNKEDDDAQEVSTKTTEAKVDDGDGDAYEDLRSVLRLVTVLCAPYRVVRDEGCPTMTCTMRLMLCSDPSIVYMGLIVNFSHPYLPEKVLEGMPIMRIIAHGWESSPTFEEVVKAYIQARRKRRERHDRTQKTHTTGTPTAPSTTTMTGTSVGSAACGSSGAHQVFSTGTNEDAECEKDVLRLPNLVTDPLRIVPEGSLRRTSTNTPYPLDYVQVGRVVLESMAASAGDPERLLWWCRCRLLCMQLLLPPERDEVLSGPSCDFFRSVWRTERIFEEILNDADADEDGIYSDKDDKDNMGEGDHQIGKNDDPAELSAAMLIGTIADVVHSWHAALRGSGPLSTLIANYTYINPLDTINRVVPSHRKFQRGSHRCFAEAWQYRLLTDYHNTYIAVFPPNNSVYSAMSPAMVAQLTEMLRRQPHYCPVLLMRSLALTRENTNTSTSLNYGLVRSIVTVMRAYLDEKDQTITDHADNVEAQGHDGKRYGWTYEAVEVLRWCFIVLERLVTISTHESVNPIVFLLTPHGDDEYELCKHICERILHRGGHPVLLAAAFRFIAACVHHNVRDVVPALQQRGLLQTVIDIALNPTALIDYNRHRQLAYQQVKKEIEELRQRAKVAKQRKQGGAMKQQRDNQIVETHNDAEEEEQQQQQQQQQSDPEQEEEQDLQQNDNEEEGEDQEKEKRQSTSLVEQKTGISESASTLETQAKNETMDIPSDVEVDPLMYYEQAIPIVNLCSILQAFAVHSSTHAQLADSRLMRHFLWSFIIPPPQTRTKAKADRTHG